MIGKAAGKRRHPRCRRSCVLALVALAAVSGWPDGHATEADDPAWRAFQHALGQAPLIGSNADHELADSVWRPIPDPVMRDIDAGRYRLGSDLFHEGRLSSGNSVACVTCHAGALSGADRRRVSIGVDGARGTMNALSVFNAGFNFRQFWDGRAVTLEDQALEPIQNPVEMANTLEAVLAMLRNDPQYPNRFAAVYPDGVTVRNMADAIAHFQRVRFVRGDTPFQRYLRGQEDALDEQEKRGMRRFREIGCTACHNGINLGGNSYQRTGAAVPYYDQARPAGPEDSGVMDRSGRERDRHVFRVPGLHGVATTSPYFHDGSVATLAQAIDLMAEYQLGRQLTQKDREAIEAFLRSLGGYFTAGGPDGEAPSGDPARTGAPADQSSTGSHSEAYRDAVESVIAGGNRLFDEMRRVHAGEVAHFDFLQLAHREMIRHARALQYPPSSLNDGQRAMRREAARQLLSRVHALEWPIADFLRAEAIRRVYSAHQDSPPAGATHPGVDSVRERLRDARERAGQAMEDTGSALDAVRAAAASASPG